MIVTGLRIPGSYKPEDQVKYAKQLAEISDKCQIYVVTNSKNIEALTVLGESYKLKGNIERVWKAEGHFERFIPDMVLRIYENKNK